MKINIVFDEAGFATGWGSDLTGERMVELDLPEDHPFFSCIMAHRFQDGELHFDADRLAQLIEEEKMLETMDPQEELKMLKRRQDESENAILTLMEITLMGGM